jgi:putative transposase
MFKKIRQSLGVIFHELARQKECHIIEGHLMPDHVHMCIEIPPKHAVAFSHWLFEGQECDYNCSSVWREAAQFSG